MRRISLLVGLAVSLLSFAEDKEVIPLKDRTSPGREGSIILPSTDKPIGSASNSDQIPVGRGKKSDTESTATSHGHVNEIKPYVASVETYGSSRINEIILKETLGSELNEWIEKGLAGDPSSLDLEVKLAEKVKTKFGFVTAEWSVVQYFEPEDMAIHITLDVVEPQEAGKRMPFLSNPIKQLRDPSGLIKHWIDYEQIAMELIESGQLEPESETCPAFHCPFGHKHVRLKKYEKIFVEGVKKHAADLNEILQYDKRPDFRAASAYLLAYQKDGKKLVSQMVSHIKDSDSTVRNNVLRVLGDVAEFHPDLIIPIKPVLEAFEFPRVSDRSKALYVAYLLSLNSQQSRDEILKAYVPTLLQIMASHQPDHRDLSHSILRKISSKDYPANDLQAWSNWFTRLPKNPAISRR